MDKKKNDLLSNQQQLNDYNLLEETKKLRTAKSTVFVSKKNQYEDAQSTAVVFSIFGIVGDLFALLGLLDIYTLPFMATTYSQCSMMLLFTIFLIIGIVSWRKSKRLKEMIGTEEENDQAISSWLKETYTLEDLSSLCDENVADEINFLNQLDFLKNEAKKQFHDCPEDQIEHIAEDFLNELLDN